MQPHASTLAMLAILQPSLAAFCNFTGGFANRLPGPCGSGTPTACDGTLDGYANTRCCPSNSRCDISGGNAYCCSDGEDCASRVVDAPKCADQASDLWHFGETLPADSWCCDRTHFGVAVFNSQGTFLAAACAPSDRPLAPVTAGYFQAKATRPSWGCTGALATNLPTPTATGSPSPTASTSTQQRASTLGKGGVAGIVVGCVAGVVLVGVASWFVLLFRRTRRGAERMVGGAAQGQDAADGPGRGDATPGSYRRPLVELGTTPQQVPAHEMGT